jgi:hypothetical protein
MAQIAPPDAMVLGVQLPIAIDVPISAYDRGAMFTAGAGIRLPSMFSLPFQGCYAVGRPLRDGDDFLLPPVQIGEPCARQALDEESAAALAEAWLLDARFECASVPVFVALARDLVAVGAPLELIERALFAADEEVRHTMLCSQLASAYAGVALTPILPPVPSPVDADRETALCRLATEAWLDGCIGEGAAAAQAERARQRASDASAQRALAIIARDEASHAELAWSVLAYCLRQGGRRVREAVAPLLQAATPLPAAGAPAATAAPSLLRAHGRLPPREAEALRRETARRARRRVAPLLQAACAG